MSPGTPLLPSAAASRQPPLFDIVCSLSERLSGLHEQFLLPLLNLVISVVCLLDMAGLHHHLRRRAVDIFLESCPRHGCCSRCVDYVYFVKRVINEETLIALVGGGGGDVVCRGKGKVGRVVTAVLSHNSHIRIRKRRIFTPPNFLFTAKNKILLVNLNLRHLFPIPNPTPLHSTPDIQNAFERESQRPQQAAPYCQSVQSPKAKRSQQSHQESSRDRKEQCSLSYEWTFSTSVGEEGTKD
jgi:hypothetical protein